MLKTVLFLKMLAVTCAAQVKTDFLFMSNKMNASSLLKLETFWTLTTMMVVVMFNFL